MSTANSTQPPTTQSSTSELPPQTIQIQLPAELVQAIKPGAANDVYSCFTMIAFAIVIKVTMDCLNPNG